MEQVGEGSDGGGGEARQTARASKSSARPYTYQLLHAMATVHEANDAAYDGGVEKGLPALTSS